MKLKQLKEFVIESKWWHENSIFTVCRYEIDLEYRWDLHLKPLILYYQVDGQNWKELVWDDCSTGQRDYLLATENENFMVCNHTLLLVLLLLIAIVDLLSLSYKEIANHKMKVIKLEGEVTKVSCQGNLQQRIDHHTNIRVLYIFRFKKAHFS